MGRLKSLILYQIVTGLLLLISCFALYKALTTPIIETRFSSATEMLENLYPRSDYLKDNPDSGMEDYEELLSFVDRGTQLLLGFSSRAQLIYDDLIKEKTYTVTAGIRQLWRAGDTVPALLILAFSVLFPVIKTFFMMLVFSGQILSKYMTENSNVTKANPSRLLAFLTLSHKYTMLDVFVVSVTVFAFSNQTLVSVKPSVALYWYIGYMAASFPALWLLQHLKTRPDTGLNTGLNNGA